MADHLAIYLNDQLALGTAWRELARRAAGENAGTALGAALDEVATEIAEDVETFRSIMARLGVRPSRPKQAAAVAAERIGRLKPNGHVRGYSPLSRFLELDALVMGIDGKLTLWGTLRDLAGLAERLPDLDFDRLTARAREQRAKLTPHHAAAGRAALAPPAPHA